MRLSPNHSGGLAVPNVTPLLLSLFFLFCFLLCSVGVEVSVRAKVTLWAINESGMGEELTAQSASGGRLASRERRNSLSRWD